jgi:Na+/glutamate symporter
MVTNDEALVILLLAFSAASVGTLIGIPIGKVIGVWLAERQHWKTWRKGK